MIEKFQSFGGALGSFGRSLIQRAIDLGRTLGEQLEIIKPLAPLVSPPVAAREWGQVRIAEKRQPQFAALTPAETVPAAWFEETQIPWDKPLAYKVAVYGRSLATGRFIHQEYDLTVSRPLTAGEACDEAAARLGTAGASPTVDIFSVALVGASRRAGEEWRW